MHALLSDARVLLRCLGESAVIGAAVAFGVGRLGTRARQVAVLGSVALLLPGVLAALWPDAVLVPVPGAWKAGAPAPHWRLVPAALPSALVFVLGRLARLPPGQARAAIGLGLGPWNRLRLVWLPQFGPAVASGLLLGGMLDLLAVMLR